MESLYFEYLLKKVGNRVIINDMSLNISSLWHNMSPLYQCSLYRCFAALGDVAKAHYLRETHEMAKQKQLETVRV